MARYTMATCACCGRRFVLDRFNGHHQKYCTRADCVRERKRARQRAAYSRRYQQDDAFRQREQKRAAVGGTRRRRQARAGPTAVPADASFPAMTEVLTGLVSQFCDTHNAAELAAALAGYAERGRRCAAGPAARVSPPG